MPEQALKYLAVFEMSKSIFPESVRSFWDSFVNLSGLLKLKQILAGVLIFQSWPPLNAGLTETKCGFWDIMKF